VIKGRKQWFLVAGLATVGTLAIAFMLSSDGKPDAHVGPTLYEDAPTGSVLIDLDDDVDSGDRERLSRLLMAAIAPRPWPGDSRALGRRLSAEAQLYRISPPAAELGDVLTALARDPEVEAYEIERSWQLPERSAPVSLTQNAELGDPSTEKDPRPFLPNDPYYKYQWHLDQIGMPQAWQINRGRGAVVAVLDTGVLFRDEGRFKQVPDLAQTRFTDGYDFVRRDATPDDEHGHGTHVAGTVAQSTNNGVGVAGVAPEATIMPLKVLDRNGSGRWGAIAAAIRWAADHDADVINMSLGGGMHSKTIQKAITYAHDKGVVIVAAAGNASRARVEYPAAYEHVIAVGAVRFDGELSFYSSYGRGLDLVAPGGDIRVDQNEDGMPDGVIQNTMVNRDPGRHDYLAWQGTSMATPHVAGVAALLRASGVRDPDTIEQILLRTAESKGPRKKYGAGILKADDALRASKSGLPLVRTSAAAILGLFLMAGLWRRRQLDASVPQVALVALLLTGAVALLPLPTAAAPYAAGWSTAVALAGPAAPLLLSALPVLLLAGLALGIKRLGPSLIVGAGIAIAALALTEAALPVSSPTIFPHWLLATWLTLNAAASLLIARLAATKARP